MQCHGVYCNPGATGGNLGGNRHKPLMSCPQMPLTDTAIRKAKPTDKTQRLADGGGMYLEIAPTGGKEKRLSLGTYPDTGLADARGKRDDARKLLAAGVDPGEHRKAEKAAGEDRAANSFEVVAREWHAKTLRKTRLSNSN